MTIKELCQPKPGQTKMTIVFEDDSHMKVLPAVVADLGLYSGQELSEEELAQLHAAAGRESAKNRAVRIISATGITKKELQHRLEQKGETEADAANAVQWLTDLSLLDDRQTAQQIVERGISRGYGKNRIRQLLYEKRVPREYWDEALQLVPEMDEAIDRFLHSRLHGPLPERKELQRVIDALLRRGHSFSDIQAGLRRYSSEIEDFSED